METRNFSLYIVVPCYNEQEALPETNRVLTSLLQHLVGLGKISEKSRVCYVDDGSKDSTWGLIRAYCQSFDCVEGIKLSRNRGHQNAVMAGLMTAKEFCDMAVSIDADLQDDPLVIEQFVDKFLEGCDVVYGVRNDRTSDSSFKRSTAEGYYKLLSMLGVEIVFNHADYRLLSRRALDALAQYGETNLFLRGIVPQLGYKTAEVQYARNPRTAGQSKYTLSKMLSLATDGITSFSVRPLRIVTAFSAFLAAICVALWIVFFFLGMTLGAATILSVWTACALIMLSVSLVGEYVGRAYLEVKHRPRYFISEYIKK